VKLGGALAIAIIALTPAAAATPSAQPTALLTFSAGEALVSPKGLCIASPNGRQRYRLLAKRHYDVDSALSPRGRYVAFARFRERPAPGAISQIYLATARGRIVRNLTYEIRGQQSFNLHPSWSPDGRRIAFETAWYGSRIYLVDRKGTNLIPTPILGEDPEWTPDGRRIVFTRDFHFPPYSNVYTTDSGGGDERLLIEGAHEPALSPDGRRIAFVRWPTISIWVADADGSGAAPLVEAIADEILGNPAWSPDGRQIAYERTQPSVSAMKSIVIADAETGRELAVVRGPGGAYDPSWRPAVALPKANRPPCR
jgi:Tol biopolymer transport system component